MTGHPARNRLSRCSSSTVRSSAPTGMPPGGKKGGADNAIGRSRRGLSTKTHAVVDERGLPVTPPAGGVPTAQALVGDRLRLTDAGQSSQLPRRMRPTFRPGGTERACAQSIEAFYRHRHLAEPWEVRHLRGPAKRGGAGFNSKPSCSLYGSRPRFSPRWRRAHNKLVCGSYADCV